MKKVRWYLAILMVFLFASTTPAYALEFVSNPLSDIKAQDCKLAWQISKAYEMAVSSDQVCYLSNGLEYGEIALLFALVEASGKSPEEIYELRGKDLGWGSIADKLGVKLSDVLPQVSDTLKDAKMANEAAALKTKIEQEKNTGDKAITSPEKQNKIKIIQDPQRKTGHTINPKLS